MREKVKRTIILTVTLIFVYVDSVYAYPAQCSISVTRREQQQSNWCWAATAQMIGGHYRPLKTQNNIVTFVKGSAINEGAKDHEVANAIYFALDCYYEVTTRNSISFSDVQSYIARGRLLGIKMQWSSGSGAHALVLSGYRANQQVTLVDPAVGRSEIRSYGYANLINGTSISSGTGRWVKTWTLD